MSFFDWFASLVPGKNKGTSERLSEKAFIPSGTGEAMVPRILLAGLAGDKGGDINKRLGELLIGIKGVEVFQRKKTLKFPDGVDDPAPWFAWLGPLRELSLGLILSGIVLALVAIGDVLGFQFGRIKEIITTGN